MITILYMYKRLKSVKPYNNPEMKNNDEEPKGPANRGSNTVAAKASTQPELQRNCLSANELVQHCDLLPCR